MLERLHASREIEAVRYQPAHVDESGLVGSRCGPFDRALEALEAGSVDVSALVSERFDLSRGVEALEHARTRPVLKVLLDVAPEA